MGAKRVHSKPTEAANSCKPVISDASIREPPELSAATTNLKRAIIGSMPTSFCIKTRSLEPTINSNNDKLVSTPCQAVATSGA